MEIERLVSRLNTALGTVEVSMTASRFSAIEPTRVPSLALRKYSKAFQNHTTTGQVRFPDNPDRAATADKFETSAD